MVGQSSILRNEDVPTNNIDRIFHGYHQHHHHNYNPYDSHMGAGTMYIPSYKVYGQHQGYGMKAGSSSEEQGHTSYGSYYQGIKGGEEHAEVPYIPKTTKKKGHATALSALTLLAFLFFLNLLQNCLKENMLTMNPTVMVMTAGLSKEGSENIENNNYERSLMMLGNDNYSIFNKTKKNIFKNDKNNSTQSVSQKLQNIFNEGTKTTF